MCASSTRSCTAGCRRSCRSGATRVRVHARRRRRSSCPESRAHGRRRRGPPRRRRRRPGLRTGSRTRARDQPRCDASRSSTRQEQRASRGSCSPPRAATTARCGTRKLLATEEWEPATRVAVRRDEGRRRARGARGDRRPGFATMCLRFATVYGTSPRMRFDLTVNEFARDALLKRELVVYGEQFWRPYVHVRDAAQAVAAVLAGAGRDRCTARSSTSGTRARTTASSTSSIPARARVPDTIVERVHKDGGPAGLRVGFEKSSRAARLRDRAKGRRRASTRSSRCSDAGAHRGSLRGRLPELARHLSSGLPRSARSEEDRRMQRHKFSERLRSG